MTDPSAARTPDFDLTMDEIREVTKFTVEAARRVLPIFQAAEPADDRPQRAIDAAAEFASGAARSRVQRLTAPAAHRAGKEATNPAAAHAATAAGDAAASAYLHPLADAADPAAATDFLDAIAERATPTVIDVLRRYPPTAEGSSRVSRLMHQLDRMLRASAAS